MKYGCCSNLLVGGPGGSGGGGSGIEFLDQIVAAGFDYIEMPIGQMMQLPDPEFEQLVRQIDASGVLCEVCTNFFLSSMRLTGASVDDEAIDRYVARALKRAQALQARVVVFGSGQARSVPAGFSHNEAFLQLSDMLKRINPIAEACGVTIVIEPLRHQESNIINTFAEGCRLASSVNGSHVKVLVDYYHLATEREPAQHIIDGADWLRHVHCAGLNHRCFPTCLDDSLNLDFFRALKTIGYDERISLEAFTDDFDDEAPAALLYLKEQMASAELFR